MVRVSHITSYDLSILAAVRGLGDNVTAKSIAAILEAHSERLEIPQLNTLLTKLTQMTRKQYLTQVKSVTPGKRGWFCQYSLTEKGENEIQKALLRAETLREIAHVGPPS